MTESRMELFIETLTGTAFEISCSPMETIISIKAKIQFSEGIPVSQQHLIWKSEELNDDLCLQDYSISDGATLKLVLGMRGGPINTRQVTDPKKLKDIAEYVERNSEGGSSNGRPLTVLVFHDGDKVHMYTLMEKGSPLISETSSIASIKNVEELDRENEITRGKITQLQEQLRALSLNKPKKVSTASQRKPQKGESFHLPPLQRVDAIDCKPKQYSSYQGCKIKRRTSHAALNLISDSISTYILSSPDKSSLEGGSSFLPHIREKEAPLTSSQVLSTQRLVELDVWLKNRPKTTPSYGRTKSRRRRSSLLMLHTNSLYTQSENTVLKESPSHNSQHHNEPSSIPSVISSKTNDNRAHSGRKLPFIKSKKRSKRCSVCSRKTGLATSYTCRCGKNFCASHRYAEVHDCTYDYKREGRRLLQLNNPLVTASKLPKI